MSLNAQTTSPLETDDIARVDAVAASRINNAQRRRVWSMQDPALLFGTAVFAQMVAADLSQTQPTEALLPQEDESAGADTSDEIALTEEPVDGLFGEIASVSALAPAAGGLAVLRGLPSGNSDAAAASASMEGASADESGEPANQGSSSFVNRNATALRNGGQPSADGATGADPAAEASGAQEAAADAPAQFAGSGGSNPFAAGLSTQRSFQSPAANRSDDNPLAMGFDNSARGPEANAVQGGGSVPASESPSGGLVLSQSMGTGSSPMSSLSAPDSGFSSSGPPPLLTTAAN